MYLRKNLYWLRKIKKLSQAEIATACGVARTTYANYEDGFSEPKASEIIGICQFHGISIDDFLTRDLENAYLNKEFTLPGITKNESLNASANESLKKKKGEINERNEQTDLLILKQLNYLTDQVDKISKNIDRKGT